MFCVQCGNTISSHSKFCKSCGSEVRHRIPKSTGAATPSPMAAASVSAPVMAPTPVMAPPPVVAPAPAARPAPVAAPTPIAAQVPLPVGKPSFFAIARNFLTTIPLSPKRLAIAGGGLLAVIAALVLIFGNFGGGPATMLEGTWVTEDRMHLMEFRGSRITWEEYDTVHTGTFSVVELDFLNFIALEILWNDAGGIPEVIDAQLVGNVMYFYPRGVLGGTLTFHRQR